MQGVNVIGCRDQASYHYRVSQVSLQQRRGRVSMLLGDGTGNFNPVVPFDLPGSSGVSSVAIADFDADFNLDVFALRFFQSVGTILFGIGSGRSGQTAVMRSLIPAKESMGVCT